MPSVLFVCTANRFRSPIAAAWFSRRLQKEVPAQAWSVGSAGTWAEPGLGVVPSSKWMADELGLDLDAHRAIRIDRELLNEHHLILVMEEHHREALLVEFPQFKDRVFLLAKVTEGVAYDVPEPDEILGDTFLDIAREVCGLVDKGFQEICLLARSLE
jgi:protein-tyrosine phosphatase